MTATEKSSASCLFWANLAKEQMLLGKWRLIRQYFVSEITDNRLGLLFENITGVSFLNQLA